MRRRRRRRREVYSKLVLEERSGLNF